MIRKAGAICLALFLFFSNSFYISALEPEDREAPSGQSADAETAQNSYDDYLARWEAFPAGRETILLPADSLREGTGVETADGYAEYPGACVTTAEDGAMTHSFEVPEDGRYVLTLDYYPMPGTSHAIERRLLVDGACPFREAETLELKRAWGDAGDVLVDSHGNESRPPQEEKPRWLDYTLSDRNGFYTGPLQLGLTKGTHTITLQSLREPAAIGAIRLEPAARAPSYREARERYTFSQAGGSEYADLVQAEDSTMRSEATLYPIWDRSSPLTQPMDYRAIKLNAIGGSQWKLAGQWIEWEINAPADGLYRLGLRVKQDVNAGLQSTRRMTIDGRVLFEEMNALSFPYDSGWQFYIPGDGQGDYLFELTQGRHTVRLEVVMGGMGDIIRAADALLLKLNEAYREIIVITGASPDAYRDYFLDVEIPETLRKLDDLSGELTRVSGLLSELLGQRSNQNALLDRLALQAAQIAQNPESVATRLAAFKGNISALGTWSLGIREQALEIDYIALMPEKAAAPRGESGFFGGLWHELRLFAAAFVTDYNSIGDIDAQPDAITAWVTSGREQATIIKQMVNRQYDRPVNLELVDAAALLPSIISGRGPDVALGVSSAAVQDYALRQAILPLDDRIAAQTLRESFYDSALVPLQMEGAQYALPETQTFPILFYRTDIFEQLGLEVPDTWEDLYGILHDLQKRGLQFGLPATIQGYSLFLFQQGSDFYRDGGKRTALDSDISIDAFRMFTNLFSNYGLPVAYDFPNRFRSGEMPIGIADYSMYNQLAVFAPEIKGLWSFAPLIGTKKPDGSIDRSVAGAVTGAVVLSRSENADAGVAFVEWWTGAQAQAEYAREMESLMGTAARYTVANKQAMARIPWDREQLAVLRRQWESVRPIAEVPGGYYTSRYVDFAYRAVVIQKKPVRETLLDYSEIINKEISRRRREFNLELYEGA